MTRDIERPATLRGQGSRTPILRGLEAVSRVARAVLGAGDLHALATGALAEMPVSLGLRLAVLYLADLEGAHVLHQFASSSLGAPDTARDRLVLDADAWRLVRSTDGPLVFREAAGWLMDNPFEPAAGSWLVLPLTARGGLIGAVIAAAEGPISLDPVARLTLTSLGGLLSAAVSTAQLRAELLRIEVERERMRLATELHDGLAQDLALAMREIAVIERSGVPPAATASLARLRAAVTEAHRVVRAGLEDLAISLPLGGVSAAVAAMCARFEDLGQQLELRLPDPVPIADPAVAAVILRVLHESLSNVLKHAPGAPVVVALEHRPGHALLTVTDAGPGLQGEIGRPGDGHFGVAIMRERARRVGGSLAVESPASGGTRVCLVLPLDVPDGV